MRWGSTEERFARPVRWLLGVADGTTVPFRFGELVASNVTYGHRYLAPGPITITDPEAIREHARGREGHGRPRPAQGQHTSLLARSCASRPGWYPVRTKSVLDEVVQLVEWPGVVLGRFDERHLRLPREVLVHAMEEHQRYFPVTDAEGNLQPAF